MVQLSVRELMQVQTIPFVVRSADAPQYLALHRNPAYRGLGNPIWQPVTGGKRENESFLDTIQRKLNGEVGGQAELIVANVHRFAFEKPDVDVPGGIVKFTEYVFGAQMPKDFKPVLSDEHTEYKWCGFDEAFKLYTHESNKTSLMRLNELVKRF